MSEFSQFILPDINSIVLQDGLERARSAGVGSALPDIWQVQQSKPSDRVEKLATMNRMNAFIS